MSKINITVKDDYEKPVQGAKVTLTSGDKSYTTGETGSAGGASLTDVPYGTYSVNITLPEGNDYELLSNYDNIIVDKENVDVNLTVHKVNIEDGG